MFKRKGELLLGLILFLLLFVVPFLSFGSRSGRSSDSSSGVKVSSGISSADGLEASGTTFRILDDSNGQILTVSDRDFLYGAVAAEMSPEAETEALKAQAVACYTYYCRQRSLSRKSPSSSLKGADFSADTQKGSIYCSRETMKQRWADRFEEEYEKLTSAVDPVFGQVLTSGGDLIDATYFAISSGNTENAKDVWGGTCSYLISVASPGDVFAGGYQTTVTVSADQFKSSVLSAAPKADLSGDPAQWVGSVEHTAAGVVKTAVLGGQTLTGSQIRSAFDLRSANFTLQYANSTFVFTVKGYGHGVGMSQAGAQYMAKQGADYRRILAWYYPTTSLASL